MKNTVLIPVLIFVTLLSCKKKAVDPIEMNYDYAPMNKGTYQIYDVLERDHLSNGMKAERQYQLKTILKDTFIDNEGRVNREFFRFKRDTPQDEWVVSDLWIAYTSKVNFELVEENERLVKLVFPISKTKVWNLNAYNTQPIMNCKYIDVFTPKTINGHSFPETATVLQEEEKNLIMYRKKYEVYAKGVGMVKKHYQHLNISNFDTTQVRNGKELFYTIVSFGVE